MTKANLAFVDFSSGELSPKLYGRFDLGAFYSGHKRIEDFIVDSVGQARFRNGFYFAAETAGNNKAFLYPWVYNTDIAFILEFTDQKLRFYINDGIVETAPDTPYEVTTPYTEAQLFELKFAQDGLDMYITHPSHNPKKLTYTSSTSWTLTDHSPIRETLGNFQRMTAATVADPCVVTYAGGDNFTDGQKIRITGVSGMTELNDKFFLVNNVNTGANTFELQDTDGNDIDATGYNTYSSGGIITPIIESAAPFLSSDEYPSCVGFFEDRLIYGGSNNKPQTLYFSRSANFDDFSLGDEVDDGIEYVVLGDGNSIRWLRGTSKFLAIGVYGDVLQATGGIDDVITPSSISIRPSNGYGVDNINPLGRNTNVFYMQNDSLVLRSFEFEFETDSYIPQDRNILADHITSSGVTQIAFQEGRPNIIWAAKNNGELIGLTIEESESVTGWHRHTTQGEIVSIAALPRENQDGQLWACVKRTINGVTKYYVEYMADEVVHPERKDYFTNNKTSDEAMWANQTFEAQKGYIYLDSCLTYDGTSAGVDASADVLLAASSGTSITFTATASVFASGDVGKEIWKKSTTGAETGRAKITGFTSATEVTCDIIEDFDSTDTMTAGNWYLTTDTVSGLTHLEAETVAINADGGQHPTKTVSSGSVTLERQASVVQVGLSYTGYIETNSLEGAGTNGTSQTKKKSLNAVGLRFLNSLFAKVGEDYYNMQQIFERTAAMKMDRPPLPFTGDKKIRILNKANSEYDGGWEREKNVIVMQENPFPCTVQLIIPYINTSNV